MVDWTAHYDAIYASQGFAAELSIGTADYDLTVVDATQRPGIEAGGILVQTIAPRVCVRVSELTENSIDRASLRGATLVIGPYTWLIKNTEPRPGALGKGSGEVLLVLEEPA
jgi:hypothetical protein